MRKSDERTKNKIDKLSKSLGKFGDDKKKNVKVEHKEAYNSPFKTSEIIILLLLTCVVSVLMGGLVTYRITYNSGKNVDKDLQSFIENYDYITNNYYGEVDKSELINSAISGMLSSLDSYSNSVGDDDSNFNIYLEGNYKGVGIQVYNDDNNNVIIDEVFDNSPASEAGLKAGDILIKVNDESVLNKNTSEVSELIKAQKNSFSLTYKRGEEEKTVQIKVSTVDLKSVTSEIFEHDGKKIGYIYMSIFAANSYEQFKKELKTLETNNIDSLILDFRNNSGGHLSTAEKILSLFLDSTHPIYQIKSKDGQNKYYSKGKKDKKYKIVVLVNGDSASASEVTASALKEQYGASIVGMKTYGKGTVQELQTLPSGEKYKLTTKNWLTSKGKKIDGVGIEPDIEVALDEAYYNEPSRENDNQLKKAIAEAIK